VARAEGPPVRRHGHVDGFLDEQVRLVLLLESGLPLGERLVDRRAGQADPYPGVLACLRWQRADLAVGQSEG